MTIIHAINNSFPPSSFPQSRSEESSPAFKRRKLNVGIAQPANVSAKSADNLNDEFSNNDIRPMVLEISENTVPFNNNNDLRNSTKLVMMVDTELSAQALVDSVLRGPSRSPAHSGSAPRIEEFDGCGSLSVSMGSIHQYCMSRGIHLSAKARTELVRAVARFWE